MSDQSHPNGPSPSDAIAVQINGELQPCPDGLNLPALLEHLGLNPRLLAVEYNGEILHRQYWEGTAIRPGDQIEIVTIVGGG
ncbi:MAG: sulfur carrier protein ThiS [Cyanobacteria bacterium]|nr:sulfur carrier protein ThiS [Cyanobacteriota bacterium]